MSAQIEKIFSEVAAFTKTMGTLHKDFLEIVQRDIVRYLEESDKLNSQMQWQGKAILGLSFLSFACTVGSAAMPAASTGGSAASTSARNSANAGLADAFSTKMHELGAFFKNNEVLKTGLKSSGEFFHSTTGVANSWFQSRITQIESRKRLIEQINLQNGQQGKTNCDTQVQQAQNAVLRILEGKSKGG